jgi:hypothetical protein
MSTQHFHTTHSANEQSAVINSILPHNDWLGAFFLPDTSHQNSSIYEIQPNGTSSRFVFMKSQKHNTHKHLIVLHLHRKAFVHHFFFRFDCNETANSSLVGYGVIDLALP